jgi:hypothetical protein
VLCLADIVAQIVEILWRLSLRKLSQHFAYSATAGSKKVRACAWQAQASTSGKHIRSPASDLLQTIHPNFALRLAIEFEIKGRDVEDADLPRGLSACSR